MTPKQRDQYDKARKEQIQVRDWLLGLMSQSPQKPATKDEINAAFKSAAGGSLKGILEYTDAPIVSSDIVTNPHSCVFDSELTMSMGSLVKVLGWYDNEWGYSNRLVDMTLFLGTKLPKRRAKSAKKK